MSRKLLNKLKKRKTVQPRHYDWRAVIFFPIWVLASFYAAQAIVGGSLWLLVQTGFEISRLGSETVIQTAFSAAIYAFALLVAFGVPYLFGKKTNLETVGMKRLMSWLDIGLAPFAYIAYVIALVMVIALVTHFFPGFDVTEAQDVGFRSITSQIGYMLAFITLVVVAPVAEEVLFRGYLYGKMRRRVPIWVCIIATSALFAFVHGQWNVAVDTFVLSVFLCGLREITGSIWSGILVHMIKNMIAFYLLFIAPVLTPGLGS